MAYSLMEMHDPITTAQITDVVYVLICGERKQSELSIRLISQSAGFCQWINHKMA